MKNRYLTMVFVLGCFACGSSAGSNNSNSSAGSNDGNSQVGGASVNVATTGSGTVDGAVGSDSFAIADATYFTGQYSGTTIYLNSVAGICANLQSNATDVRNGTTPPHLSGQQLVLSIYAFITSTPATYSVGGTSSNNIQLLYVSNANDVGLTATEGTIVVTSANANQLVGTYSATFDNPNGTLSGSFTAGDCNVVY